MASSLACPPTVVLVTPAGRRSRSGNRITALRWAAILRRLGLHVTIVERWQDQPCDLLVAVHAVKTASSVLAASAAMPHLKVVVLLAGTDVYPHFAPGPEAVAALERASALIALQPNAAAALPPHLRPKVRTILQSATAHPQARSGTAFRVCVLAHLRPVKDPLLPVQALAHVPRHLPIELHLAGRAMTPELAAAAHAAVAAEPRAHWHGEMPRRAALDLLATSHLCIVPSTSEGGANVVSEAIAAGTPILATAIPGNLGLLGDDWPGRFPVGDDRSLALLITRAAVDPTFYQLMVARTHALQRLVEPRRELAAWRQLLTDLGLPVGPARDAEV